MKYTELGKTGVKISELVLGSWGMGGERFGEVDDKDSLDALRESIAGGVNTLDTAEVYGPGSRAEAVMGQVVSEVGRENVVIMSKVGTRNMAHIQEHFEDSLKRLNTDYLDVYFLHHPVSNDEVHIRDRMAAMMKLKKEGRIKAIGVSNFSIEQTKEAMEYGDVDIIQPCFNLLWRWELPLIEFCRDHGIGVVTYSSLAQGLLTNSLTLENRPTDSRRGSFMFLPGNYEKSMQMRDLLGTISAKYGKTAAQGAIKYLQQYDGVTAPIVGALNGKEAKENADNSNWEFTPEDFKTIDDASKAIQDSLENPHCEFHHWVSPEPRPQMRR